MPRHDHPDIERTITLSKPEARLTRYTIRHYTEEGDSPVEAAERFMENLQGNAGGTVIGSGVVDLQNNPPTAEELLDALEGQKLTLDFRVYESLTVIIASMVAEIAVQDPDPGSKFEQVHEELHGVIDKLEAVGEEMWEALPEDVQEDITDETAQRVQSHVDEKAP